MERHLTVLLVEDVTVTAQALVSSIVFRDKNITVEVVTSVKSAITRLKKGGINVVLADLGLPDAKGVEAIKAVKNTFPKMPLVAVSGVGGKEILELAMKAGAGDFLEKGSLNGETIVMSLRKEVIRKEIEEKYAKYWQSREETEKAVENAEDVEQKIISSTCPTKLHVKPDTTTEEDVKKDSRMGYTPPQSSQSSQSPQDSQIERDGDS